MSLGDQKRLLSLTGEFGANRRSKGGAPSTVFSKSGLSLDGRFWLGRPVGSIG
jgi:hypothetical protein